MNRQGLVVLFLRAGRQRGRHSAVSYQCIPITMVYACIPSRWRRRGCGDNIVSERQTVADLWRLYLSVAAAKVVCILARMSV